MFNDFPFFDGYSGLYSPHDSFRAQQLQNQRRQRALEAERRQRALEAERRQRALEAERRRRAEWGLRQRQLYDLEEKRKKEEMQRQREQEYWRRRRMEEETYEQGYRQPTIVRGSDGRLYRIEPREYDSFSANDERKLFSNDGNTVKMNMKESPPKAYKKDSMDIEEEDGQEDSSVDSGSCDEVEHREKKQPIQKTRMDSGDNVIMKPKLPSSLIVGVEDASDDEEDEDLKSIWRNRLPSEGQWLEPVEYY